MKRFTQEEFQALTHRQKAKIFESTTLKRVSHKTKVYDVGFNDVDFRISILIEGRTFYHPAWSSWQNMLRRCYYQKNKNKYSPSIVAPEWHYFSRFLSWWHENFIEGFELDKDIGSMMQGLLVKTYGPSTCKYIPKWENMIHRCRNGKLMNIRLH